MSKQYTVREVRKMMKDLPADMIVVKSSLKGGGGCCCGYDYDNIGDLEVPQITRIITNETSFRDEETKFTDAFVL